MIKYDLTNINKWYNGSRNIVKCYHGTTNAFDLTGGGAPTPPTPTGQTPCYAVTDDISQYQSTDFVDVYDTTADKWYKLNNLNEYEQYGIYGSGRTNTTYYEGKLTIDNGYEYIYSGNSWVNLGEVSGSTATLPDVPFTVNYNAKNYNPSTYTIPMTDGQLNNMDAVITGKTNLIVDHHEDGYIELTGTTSDILRANISNTSVNQYFNRDSNNPNLTIICKAYTPGSSTEGNIIANRDNNYNWMYRHKSALLTLHGNTEQGSIAVSNTVPNICSARINSNRQLTYNNYTQGTTSTYSGTFSYGSNTTTGATLFAGYSSSSGEQWKGVFYWVYMSQNTLTDEQVQQVIDYNEGNGGSPTYPEYYDEIAEPPTSVTFATMADALAYQCPYVGLRAIIAGDKYVFNENYEWEEVTSRLPVGYTELTYVQTIKQSVSTSNYFTVPINLQPTYNYTFEFTPLSWEDSYYGILIGGNDGNTTFPNYGFLKLDNGWGTMERRFVGSFYNYDLTTRSSGALTGKWRVYTDVKAKLTTHLNGYTAGNGAVLKVENDGYSAVELTSTTKYNSSYTVTDGVYNICLFSTSGGGTMTTTALLQFHGLRVDDNNGHDVYNYVPCKRDSDDKVGLYDIVNNAFYAPSGFTLVAGPEV